MRIGSAHTKRKQILGTTIQKEGGCGKGYIKTEGGA